MTDLEIAIALEVQLAGTLVPPGGCGCPLYVIGQHVSHPWYKVRLGCKHELTKIRAMTKTIKGGSGRATLISTTELPYGWFTLSGERVPDQLVRAMAHQQPEGLDDL